MKFDILKKDQYLNVFVWSRSQEKNDKDIILGYVSNDGQTIFLLALFVIYIVQCGTRFAGFFSRSAK